MNFTVQADTSRAESLFTHLMDVVRNESVPRVGKTYIEELPKLFAKGLGGDGQQLPPYNTQYAHMLGIARSPKTLSRGSSRLYDLVMEGNLLTVADATIGTANSRDVALGQQTGHSGDWPYSNVMFGLNDELQNIAAIDLAEFITERIGH